MIWHWRYFIAAAILVGFLLISNGVPPVPVAAGLAGMALFMFRRKSRLS